MIYRLLLKLLLQRLEPESAHALAIGALRLVSALPGGLWALRALCGQPDACLRVSALGLSFPTPLGVAAGVDKDAACFEALGALGFGFVEVGTLTAVPQAGNERPRVFRIAQRRALLNRMGFPNAGAQAADERLRRRRRRMTTIVGANVGKSRVTPLERAAEDYRAAAEQLARGCDYLALNVSSPNTPGLRELQAAGQLRAIVGAVRDGLSQAGVRLPVLVKISPDCSDAQIDELVDVALELSLDGIIAVNTTLERSGLEDCARLASAQDGGAQGGDMSGGGASGGGAQGGDMSGGGASGGGASDGETSGRDVSEGGISGAPLKRRSVEVLRRLRARAGERLALISVGGVETAEDVWERVLAGASLVQGYTGFVYNGPGWARSVNRGLARLVCEAGGASIQEFVGAGGAALRAARR